MLVVVAPYWGGSLPNYYGLRGHYNSGYYGMKGNYNSGYYGLNSPYSSRPPSYGGSYNYGK